MIDITDKIREKTRHLELRGEISYLLESKCLIAYIRATSDFEGKHPHIRIATDKQYQELLKQEREYCLSEVDRIINEYKADTPTNPSGWS